MKYCILILTIIFQVSCIKYVPIDRNQALPQIPSQYSLYSEDDTHSLSQHWWKEFNSAELNRLMDKALADNFTIHEAWSRFKQTQFTAVKTGANIYPTLDLATGVTHSKNNVKNTGQTNSDTWALGFSSSYEFDLWGRINAENKIESYKIMGSKDDIKTAMISISGQLAEDWISYISQKQQNALYVEQLKLQEQLLDLIKIRFPLAQSTALDIYQQQQAIEKLKTDIIVITSAQKSYRRKIVLLSGQAHLDDSYFEEYSFPIISSTPSIGIPTDLLANRPDIRAAGFKLKSAQWEIVAAKADRLPAFKISASHTYSADKIRSLFDNWLLNLAANITGPIFDGNRRKAEVERVKALVEERIATYGNTVFSAIKEVEDALAEEEQQTKTYNSLTIRLSLANKTIREAKRRYLNGNLDFLNVLNEQLNILQLKQNIIIVNQQIIIARIKLYKALGGGLLGQEDKTYNLIKPEYSINQVQQ